MPVLLGTLSAYVFHAQSGPGVADVSVNLLKNSMAVSYDEGTLDTASIVAAVENAGYGAIPKAAARSGKEATPEVSTAQAEYKAMKQRLVLSALFTPPSAISPWDT